MPICVPQLFLASLLETRQLTIGQFFPLSFVKVPEFFAKVKGAVSRNSAKLGNHKMPVKLKET